MKAETDLYCPECGTKIYEKGGELMSLFFTRSEECCSQCDTMLRRRSPGGQSDPWKFITALVEIDGHLNYDEERDVYWHGVLGWVPGYVEKMKENPNPIGINNGAIYRYILHTGKLGQEVHVYFKKVRGSLGKVNK